ncbi:hypothetical protein BUALT_Bualt03G0114900 [Buddleja alternifolia]|uniref:KIB1-4 beta-propeller domain-containing protein n=1 Tax=Buddleja alternifolia TaxID=168488 RepID=A0AAV6Y3Q5_9LAMI|nr:hypothetical protein BUALT_Bualt03G0114900 [Buddleja alternifolia]
MKSGGTRLMAPPSGPCPWLVYCHGKDYEDQTFCCNISGPSPIKTYRKKIPGLHEKIILSCSYGWLILYDCKSTSLCVCNCTTFETICLPSLDICCFFDHGYILSSSPNSPDCKLLLFLKNSPTILSCGISRDKEWSEISYREQLNALDPRREDDNSTKGTLFFCEPVICGGKIYAKLAVSEVCQFPESWSIEIVEEPVGVVVRRINSRRNWIHRFSCASNEYVVESEGELFSLYIMWGGVEFRETLRIEVNKLNFETMVWERVESIKDRSFFVCRDYGISSPVSGPGYIYFTMGADQSLYCYNMEEDSVLVSLPASNLPKPWHFPVWIMPEELIRLQEDCCNDSNKGQNDIVPLDSKDDCEEDLCEKQLSNLQLDVPPINSLSRSETNVSFPLLMFPHKGRNVYNFVDPIANHTYFVKIPEILKDTTIRYSDHGWLVMSRIRAIHLYNPFTGDVISTKTMYENSFLLVSKPSGGSDSHFVAVSFHINNVDVDIHYPRTDKLIRRKLQSNKEFIPTYNIPTFFKDAFYYIDENGSLGKLRVEEENCTWEVMEQTRKPCNTFHQIFLVECGGELLSVFIGSAGKWVLVCKLNASKNAWEIMTSLSNYNLYLSRCSSFSVMASPGAGNKIYFPRFRGGGIVFYSLDTGKWHSYGSQDSSNNFYDTKLMLDSCWINPSWC